MAITIRIPAVPVAQPRAKAAFRGQRATVYTPTTIKQSDGSRKAHPIVAFKATVRLAAERLYVGAPLIGPLRVDCQFVLPRPKSLMRKKDPDGRIPHSTKPDRDNLDKAVLDSLTGLVWADDKQAASGLIEKWFAGKQEQPHVLVVVWQWQEGSWK